MLTLALTLRAYTTFAFSTASKIQSRVFKATAHAMVKGLRLSPAPVL